MLFYKNMQDAKVIIEQHAPSLEEIAKWYSEDFAVSSFLQKEPRLIFVSNLDKDYPNANIFFGLLINVCQNYPEFLHLVRLHPQQAVNYLFIEYKLLISPCLLQKIVAVTSHTSNGPIQEVLAILDTTNISLTAKLAITKILVKYSSHPTHS